METQQTKQEVELNANHSPNQTSAGSNVEQNINRPVTRGRSSRSALYRSVQALLRSKGIRVTVYRLKRTPKRKIVNYIRNRFTPSEVAEFIPVHYIFPELGRGRSRRSRRFRVRLRSRVLLPETTTQDAVHQHAVTDIDAPLPLTEEISIPTSNYRWNDRIFATNNSSSFDPGLWLTLQEQLPQQYSIPDQQFTKALETASQRYRIVAPSEAVDQIATSPAPYHQEVSNGSTEENAQEMLQATDEVGNIPADVIESATDETALHAVQEVESGNTTGLSDQQS